MTWLPLRGHGQRMVHHLITAWRQRPGQETRYEAACGVADALRVELKDGNYWCCACREIADSLARGG